VSPRSRRALPPVAPRPTPVERSARVGQIVAAARELVETEGADALTMRRLADELGIRAPSLYKHLPGRDGVVARLVDDTLFETGDRMHQAVSGPAAGATGGPIAALLAAYRAFGREHPNLYRLVTTGDLPRSALTPGIEDWAGEPFYRATGDPYRAQALWAFAHGTLILEIDRRFLPGSDLDRTWTAGARAFAPRGERLGHPS
jgi:AcrR family transcriptional regulator